MIRKILGAALVVLSIGFSASVRSQASDAIQSLKDSLSGDKSSVLQGVLGKDGTGKKTDKKLDLPDTVQQNPKESGDEKDKIESARKKGQTLDGRILRQLDEDPELRADDSVLIEIVPLEECNGTERQRFDIAADELLQLVVGLL